MGSEKGIFKLNKSDVVMQKVVLVFVSKSVNLTHTICKHLSFLIIVQILMKRSILVLVSSKRHDQL